MELLDWLGNSVRCCPFHFSVLQRLWGTCSLPSSTTAECSAEIVWTRSRWRWTSQWCGGGAADSPDQRWEKKAQELKWQTRGECFQIVITYAFYISITCVCFMCFGVDVGERSHSKLVSPDEKLTTRLRAKVWQRNVLCTQSAIVVGGKVVETVAATCC